MPDDLRHLGKGDPIPLGRETWNAIIDAARLARDRSAAQLGAAPGGGLKAVPALQVYVQNNTGATLPQFSVVKISGTPLISAVDAPHEARRHPTLPGTTPAAATDAFAITIEPLTSAAPGNVGRAIVQGVAVCDVSVNDDAHEYATPSPGTTFALDSAGYGPARILWKNGTSGTVRAVVLITGSAPPGDSSADAFCAGLAGADEDDCLRMTVVSASGKCAGIDTSQSILLEWDAGDTRWESGPTDFTGTGSGGTGQVTFSPTKPVPTATIDGVSGQYVGCDGRGGILFAFGGPVLCEGTAERCANAFVVRFSCTCCPLEGYDGPGFYCVRVAGSGSGSGFACVAVELVGDGDECDDGTIVICSGPYETLEAAEAECPSGPAEPIPNENLPACLLQFMEENDLVSLPSVIYANFPSGFVNVGGGTCPAVTRVAMTYSFAVVMGEIVGHWGGAVANGGIITCFTTGEGGSAGLSFTYRDAATCSFVGVIDLAAGWDGTGGIVGTTTANGIGNFVPPCSCIGTAETVFTTY